MLVDYSSSDEESLSIAQGVATVVTTSIDSKRTELERARKSRLPSLPQNFHSLYATSSRTYPSDDPELHGGRTRQIPHVDGNWPTHVFLEWYPTRTELETLQAILDRADVDGYLQSLLQSELGAQLPLHISLSAPLILKGDQKNDFEEALRLKLSERGVGPVEMRFSRLRWERNFDATRWFLVLGLTKPEGDMLNKILDCCNDCAGIYSLPLLYDQFSSSGNMLGSEGPQRSRDPAQDRTEAFHISIAWQLSEPSIKQTTVLANINGVKIREEKLRFKVLKMKMGNVVKEIPLRKKNIMGGG